MSKPSDIEDREIDFKGIHRNILRTELGTRAVSVMYNEHSTDKNSNENVFRLKDNIIYRLFSTENQYKVLLNELYRAEHYLNEIQKQYPTHLKSFFYKNPHFEQIEIDLSSIFDSLIFHLTSLFDYYSHFICYIIQKNKNKTLYWTKLAKSARDSRNEIHKLTIGKVVDKVDNQFVGKLYDYRSRLIHFNRDKHQFSASSDLVNVDFRIKIIASKTITKSFKTIHKDSGAENLTLAYVASNLIKRALEKIEEIFDALEIEIQSNSNFYQNLQNPKSDFVIVFANPKTNIAEPVSNQLWKDYKNKINNS